MVRSTERESGITGVDRLLWPCSCRRGRFRRLFVGFLDDVLLLRLCGICPRNRWRSEGGFPLELEMERREWRDGAEGESCREEGHETAKMWRFLGFRSFPILVFFSAIGFADKNSPSLSKSLSLIFRPLPSKSNVRQGGFRRKNHRYKT